ncbi:MAG: hypothetical protein R3247_06820 [Rhodothermales bacterium]|nr:hypothetical protein [Rhodothermales bacterium]
MSLKDLIFQKGGIGVSMSRQETIERLNPLIERHMALNHRYHNALGHLGRADVAEPLRALLKIARVDVGKLAETVLSAGGVPYNGVAMEPSDYPAEGDDDAVLAALLDEETAWQDTLLDALQADHQIRTAAVLSLLRDNSRDRLDLLKQATRGRRRRT